MLSDVALNMALVLLFVLVGGVFAATEMALVSLRPGQLAEMSSGTRAERTVAALAADSGLFLSAVQIGVTFAGFLSSAYGASTVAPVLVPWLQVWGLSHELAATVALVGLTLVISYLSLVFGELVPKRVALQAARRVSVLTGPPLRVFSRATRPLIWGLEVSTDAVLRVLGLDPEASAEQMTPDEVRHIVSEHHGFDEDERTMIRDFFTASERLVREVMRHRSDVEGVRADETVADAVEAVESLPHSRYPVYTDSLDDIVGFVHIRDLLANGDPQHRVQDLARPILHVPGTSSLIPVLGQMRREGHHIAVVVDEYGGTDGVVTLEDLIEELVGEIWDEFDSAVDEPAIALHGTRRLDAQLNLEDFAEATGIHLPDGPYETVAGWLLAELGRIPDVGDWVLVPSASGDTDPDASEADAAELASTDAGAVGMTGADARVGMTDADAGASADTGPSADAGAGHVGADDVAAVNGAPAGDDGTPATTAVDDPPGAARYQVHVAAMERRRITEVEVRKVPLARAQHPGEELTTEDLRTQS